MLRTVSSREEFLKIPLPEKPERILCIGYEDEHVPYPTPQYVSEWNLVPNGTLMVIAEKEKSYTLLFCLSHLGQCVSLSGGDGGLALKGAKLTTLALIWTEGKDLHTCIREVMIGALVAVNSCGKVLSEKPPLPKWLLTLGWESQEEATQESILETVAGFQREGLTLGYVVLGEGWQQLTQGKLLSFEADLKRFPGGLKGLIRELQNLGIDHVGVWHAALGGLSGIAPAMARRYQLLPDRVGEYYFGAELGNTFEFFHEYYAYLRNQGVSFIKVGAQNRMHLLPQEPTRITRNVQLAIQAAASTQFNSAHLNADCLRSENLFYWVTSRVGQTAVSIDPNRSSGIFQGVRDHLVNGAWLQHLMHPDCAPWKSSGKEGELLAVLHALTGSINMIQDSASNHRKDLLAKMILPDGTLLTPNCALTLCPDSLMCNPLVEKVPYKAFTKVGEHGILGVFNLVEDGKSVHGCVSPKDVQGLCGDRFAVFSHHNGFVALLDREEQFDITLKPSHCDVFTFSPILEGFAIMGSYLFYLSPAVISQVDIEEESVHLFSCVIAPLVAYCEKGILEVRCNGHTVPWEYDEGRKILTIDSRRHLENTKAIYSIYFES